MHTHHPPVTSPCHRCMQSSQESMTSSGLSLEVSSHCSRQWSWTPVVQAQGQAIRPPAREKRGRRWWLVGVRMQPTGACWLTRYAATASSNSAPGSQQMRHTGSASPTSLGAVEPSREAISLILCVHAERHAPVSAVNHLSCKHLQGPAHAARGASISAAPGNVQPFPSGCWQRFTVQPESECRRFGIYVTLPCGMQ